MRIKVKMILESEVMNLDRLREIREDKDYREADIAKYLNVSQAQYSRYEAGVNMIPLEKIYKLAVFYNTSIDYLVGSTDQRKAYPKSILK